MRDGDVDKGRKNGTRKEVRAGAAHPLIATNPTAFLSSSFLRPEQEVLLAAAAAGMLL